MNKKPYYVRILLRGEQDNEKKAKKITHVSKNPSTIVRIPCAIVSREKNGTVGFGAADARDRMWLTMDTYKILEARQHVIKL